MPDCLCCHCRLRFAPRPTFSFLDHPGYIGSVFDHIILLRILDLQFVEICMAEELISCQYVVVQVLIRLGKQAWCHVAMVLSSQFAVALEVVVMSRNITCFVRWMSMIAALFASFCQLAHFGLDSDLVDEWGLGPVLLSFLHECFMLYFISVGSLHYLCVG